MKLVLVALLVVAAFAAWPADPSCTPAQAGEVDPCVEMNTPTLQSHNILYGGDSNLDAGDSLKLIFRIPTSWALINISSLRPDLGTPVTAAVSSTALKVSFTDSSPTAVPPCLGTVDFEVWLGALDEWQFHGEEITQTINGVSQKTWVLFGGFYVNVHRLLADSCSRHPDDGINPQQVAYVNFPFNITLLRTFTAAYDDLTVYGLPELEASIIIFAETPYPSEGVDVVYLLSVQYPYRVADMDTHTDPTNAPQGLRVVDEHNVWTGYRIGWTGPAIATDLNVYQTSNTAYQYCPETVVTTSQGFCFQTLHVHYLPQRQNNGAWENGVCEHVSTGVVYTGLYTVRLELGCRTEAIGTTWCDIPAGIGWKYGKFDFQISSNDICLHKLDYPDENNDIDAELHTFDTEAHAKSWTVTPWTTPLIYATLQTDIASWAATEQTTWIPDNVVHFIMNTRVPKGYGFRLKQLHVDKVTVKVGTTETIVAENGAWKPAANQMWYVPATDTFTTPPAFECDDVDNLNAATACQLAGANTNHPYIYFAFNLTAGSTIFNLHTDVPKTVGVVFEFTIQFAFFENGKEVEIKQHKVVTTALTPPAKEFAAKEIIIGQLLGSDVATTSGVAVGTIVGITIGCAALLSAVGALIFHKMRKAKLAKFSKQVDTTSA